MARSQQHITLMDTGPKQTEIKPFSSNKYGLDREGWILEGLGGAVNFPTCGHGCGGQENIFMLQRFLVEREGDICNLSWIRSLCPGERMCAGVHVHAHTRVFTGIQKHTPACTQMYMHTRKHMSTLLSQWAIAEDSAANCSVTYILLHVPSFPKERGAPQRGRGLGQARCRSDLGHRLRSSPSQAQPTVGQELCHGDPPISRGQGSAPSAGPS